MNIKNVAPIRYTITTENQYINRLYKHGDKINYFIGMGSEEGSEESKKEQIRLLYEEQNIFLTWEKEKRKQMEICFYENIEKPLNEQCPISFVFFTKKMSVIKLRTCNHIFKPYEIITWLKNNNQCPVCRKFVL